MRVGQKEALDTAFADSYGIAYHYRLFVRLIYKRIGFSLDQYVYLVARMWCYDVAEFIRLNSARHEFNLNGDRLSEFEGLFPGPDLLGRWLTNKLEKWVFSRC